MDIEFAMMELEEAMQKSLDFTISDYASIRTGKANPAMVEGVEIHINAYGMNMKLRQLANITTPEPRMIVVEPFDFANMKDIERGIRESRLGFNPVTYGKILRLPVPELTQERRKEMVKMLKEKSEDGKIRIRSLRRDAVEAVRKAEKANAVTEDDLKDTEKTIQDFTDKFIRELEAATLKKEAEVMQV
jgi:ribosome recycling factor